MNPENALISRKIIKLSDDLVLIDERWDLNHPESPFVPLNRELLANPYQTLGARQTVMRKEECEKIGTPPSGSHIGRRSRP